METKPIKTKPLFYSYCMAGLQEIAKGFGYNLVIHGSMSRDMDLIAIPWTDDPGDHIEMLESFCDYLGAPKQRNSKGEPDYLFSILPGGRSSYIINLNRGGKFNGYIDEEYYLDISITPFTKKTE